MTESKFIKSHPILTTTIKALVADGEDCYTKLGYGYEVNPWVWAIEFKAAQP